MDLNKQIILGIFKVLVVWESESKNYYKIKRILEL